MKVLILGSEGFIGSNLCRYFGEKNYKVFGVDIIETPTLSKYHYTKVSRLSTEWEELLSITDFDVCINAAGSGNVPYSVSHPVIDFEANTLDVIRILDAIRKYNPKCKYLHISSAAVYGNPVSLPIKETNQLQPISPYGFHKLMSEYICKEYNQLFGLSIAIIRPFSVYGTGLRKQLLWDICQKITKSVDETITLFGTGEESRDFVHIDDLVELIHLIFIKSPFQGEIYNAASGQEITIKLVAETIEKNHPPIKINFSGESRKGDPNNWRADISKITELGFRPNIKIEIGIKKYLKWFIEKQRDNT